MPPEDTTERKEETLDEIEFIKRIFSEEFVAPERKESAGFSSVVEEFWEVISTLKNDIKNLSKRVEQLHIDLTLLMESVNEIKGILLLSARPPERVPQGEETEKRRNSLLILNRVLSEAEKTIFSPADNVIAQAVKVEGLRIWLEEIFKDVESGKMKIPSEKLSEAKKLYRSLLEMSKTLRERILASAKS